MLDSLRPARRQDARLGGQGRLGPVNAVSGYLGEVTLAETFDGIEKSNFRESLKTRRTRLPYTRRLELR